MAMPPLNPTVDLDVQSLSYVSFLKGLEKGEEALVLVPENGREIAIGIQETASHPGVLGL